MSIHQEIELLKRRISEMQEELRLLELCAEEETNTGPGERGTCRTADTEYWP